MRSIGDELLWASSMPCNLPADEAIPIGRYGTSNVGRAKTVYRMGLSYRYGRRMQTISGIHYNFSLPGVGSDGYFALIRNFRRLSWLLLYLFGASPAVCTTFVEGRNHQLQELAPGTLYLPLRDLAAHGAPRLPERRAVQPHRQLQQPEELFGFAARGADPALSGLREDRHPGRRIVQAALDQPAADRERVLQPDPPQAAHQARRAPAARAARARRRVRRGAPDGPRPVLARSASPRRPCASSTSCCCIACSRTARPTRRRSCSPSRATSCAARRKAASPACASSAAAKPCRSPTGATKCSARASRSPSSSTRYEAAPLTGML